MLNEPMQFTMDRDKKIVLSITHHRQMKEAALLKGGYFIPADLWYQKGIHADLIREDDQIVYFSNTCELVDIIEQAEKFCRCLSYA